MPPRKKDLLPVELKRSSPLQCKREQWKDANMTIKLLHSSFQKIRRDSARAVARSSHEAVEVQDSDNGSDEEDGACSYDNEWVSLQDRIIKFGPTFLGKQIDKIQDTFYRFFEAELAPIVAGCCPSPHAPNQTSTESGSATERSLNGTAKSRNSNKQTAPSLTTSKDTASSQNGNEHTTYKRSSRGIAPSKCTTSRKTTAATEDVTSTNQAKMAPNANPSPTARTKRSGKNSAPVRQTAAVAGKPQAAPSADFVSDDDDSDFATAPVRRQTRSGSCADLSDGPLRKRRKSFESATNEASTTNSRKRRVVLCLPSPRPHVVSKALRSPEETIVGAAVEENDVPHRGNEGPGLQKTTGKRGRPRKVPGIEEGVKCVGSRKGDEPVEGMKTAGRRGAVSSKDGIKNVGSPKGVSQKEALDVLDVVSDGGVRGAERNATDSTRRIGGKDSRENRYPDFLGFLKAKDLPIWKEYECIRREWQARCGSLDTDTERLLCNSSRSDRLRIMREHADAEKQWRARWKKAVRQYEGSLPFVKRELKTHVRNPTGAGGIPEYLRPRHSGQMISCLTLHATGATRGGTGSMQVPVPLYNSGMI